MDYRKKAVSCVKDTVLPVQMAQFRECGCSLDKQYRKYGDMEGFFAKIIEQGRRYEVGYPKCVCPEVLSGAARDPAGSPRISGIHNALYPKPRRFSISSGDAVAEEP